MTNSKINPDIDTTSWPTQADLDPDVLYALIIGEPMLAYAISRFSSRKSAGVIPFIAACLLFFLHQYALSMGAGLGRPISSLESMVGVRALVGTRVNWAGLMSLGVGIYFATHRQE